MPTDHRHALAQFLRTDWLRLEAALGRLGDHALDGAAWSAALAQRLRDHLRYLVQVQAVYVEGLHPHDKALQQALETLTPTSTDHALDMLAERHAALTHALDEMPDARFHAPVLDPLDRGLTVLGHLYDLTRSSAALVAWVQTVGGQPGNDPLAAWFDDLTA